MAGTVRMDPPAGEEPGEDRTALAADGSASASMLLSSSDVEVVENAPPRERGPSLVGRLIGGRYRVEALLGEGGFAAVYRAEHVRMRKTVALKVLRPDAERLPEMVLRFEREAVCGAHVQHPNVASATDFGQLEDGSTYLALEFVEGERLSDLIARGPLSAERSARITRDIASALAAVHDKGIVHRDVKPENVMVGAGDQVKLIDFGLAKIKPELLTDDAMARSGIGPQLTAIGTVVGTVAYMAPEAALGMDAVDARGDLYALGLVLFEMLSGKRPFEGHDNVSLFRHQRFSPPPRIGERAPGIEVPAALEAVALRLLAKNPADRFADAPSVVRALDALLTPLSEDSVASDRNGAQPGTLPSSMPSIPGLPRRSGLGIPALRALARLPLWARSLLGVGALGAVVTTVVALNGRANPHAVGS